MADGGSHLSLSDKLELLDEFKKLLDSNVGPAWHGAQRAADVQVEFPDPVIEDIGFFGYWCLLIGFFCMALSTLYFYGAAVNTRGNKFFEVLTMAITGIASLAYLTMFSGAGRMWVEEVPGTITPVYWARYVDWLLTTPLMIWDILALAGAPKEDIMLCCVLDTLMIGFGLVGAQTPDQNKWFFFIIGCACFIHIARTLVKYSTVKKYGAEAQALYQRVAYMTILLWTLYPIVWVLCEGLRISSVNLEAMFYMAMDVTAKCLFGFFIVQSRGALEAINSGYNNIL